MIKEKRQKMTITGLAETEEDIVETEEVEDAEEAAGLEEEKTNDEDVGWNEGAKGAAKDMTALKTYMNQIAVYGDLLSAEEEKTLCLKTLAGDEEARDELVNHNLRLVVDVAKKFAGRGVDLEDLIAYGNLGLMEASRKFDPENGARFGTYAFHWIKMEIIRGMQKQKTAVTKPDHAICAINTIRRYQESLEGLLAREPSSEEISAAMNFKFSPQQIEEYELIMAGSIPLSLDKRLDSEDSNSDSVKDLVADEDSESPTEYADRSTQEQVVANAVAALEPRLRTVIRMKYGLGVAPGSQTKVYTLDEIAEQLKSEGYTNRLGLRYTKEYVRQLEAAALDKLKNNPRIKALEGTF